jgi:hypothetical protein
MRARALEGFKICDGGRRQRAPLAMTTERALARSPSRSLRLKRPLYG